MLKLISILKYIGVYFQYKNKVLWEGTWKSGAIIVPDALNYDLFYVMVGEVPCIGYRAGGWFYAFGIAQDSTTCNSYGLAAYVENFENGFKLSKATSNFIAHRPGGAHLAVSGGNGAETVSKIIGAEPTQDKMLKISTGGTKFTSLSGRCAA